MLRKDDAPVPELEITPAMLLAVINEPASKPALLNNPNAPVPEFESTPAMLLAVMKDPASNPPLDINPTAAVPALLKTMLEPDPVKKEPATNPAELRSPKPAVPVFISKLTVLAAVAVAEIKLAVFVIKEAVDATFPKDNAVIAALKAVMAAAVVDP